MVYIANNNLIFRMNHNRMGEDKGGSLVSKNIKKTCFDAGLFIQAIQTFLQMLQ